VLEQEEAIGDLVRLPAGPDPLLERDRVLVRNQPEMRYPELGRHLAKATPRALPSGR
jgi:hypothetical protein